MKLLLQFYEWGKIRHPEYRLTNFQMLKRLMMLGDLILIALLTEVFSIPLIVMGIVFFVMCLVHIAASYPSFKHLLAPPRCIEDIFLMTFGIMYGVIAVLIFISEAGL